MLRSIALSIGISFAVLIADLRANDFATQVMDATFKLYNEASTGTCFLVRRDETEDPAIYLVTAGHCLTRASGEKSLLVLRASKPDGSVERRDHSLTIRRGETPLWTQHPKHDVAVLRITEPFPVAMQPLPASVLGNGARLKEKGVHICSPLFVLTYPQRFEAHQAAYPVARQGIFATPPLLDDTRYPTFLADFATFAGDSGGPVFVEEREEHPMIVGIVLAQFRHDETVKSEYSETTLHHPLNLGTILHARYIRETIEAAASPSSPTGQ